jgi:hypothetical protein
VALGCEDVLDLLLGDQFRDIQPRVLMNDRCTSFRRCEKFQPPVLLSGIEGNLLI